PRKTTATSAVTTHSQISTPAPLARRCAGSTVGRKAPSRPGFGRPLSRISAGGSTVRALHWGQTDEGRPRRRGGSMRAIWKGSITFGLVNVPISVFSATESHDLRLHQVHDADGGRIRYQRRCEICGEPVEWDHIDKAFDDGDRTVVITDDELSELPTEK